MRILKWLPIVILIAAVIIVQYIYPNIKKINLYYGIIDKYAVEYNIDPLLVVSVIKAESNFNPLAKSRKGAVGLMQIMPSTAKEVSEVYLNYKNFKDDDLYNPEINIRIGIYYIKILSLMFDGNINLILASYNAGLGNVKQWRQKNPIIEYDPQEMPFAETKNYVSKINGIYEFLKFVDNIKEKYKSGNTIWR